MTATSKHLHTTHYNFNYPGKLQAVATHSYQSQSALEKLMRFSVKH